MLIEKEGVRAGTMIASLSVDQRQLWPIALSAGILPRQQIFFTKLYKIPGPTIDTGVGTFTPENLAFIAPLIEEGIC